MSSEVSAPRPLLNRIGGLGLYVGLVALPYATTWLLILKLFNWRTFGSPVASLIALAVFIAVTILIEQTLGRRNPAWSYAGGRICFDAALSTGEKLRALFASSAFAQYLAAQLAVVSLLSVAVTLVR